MEVFIVHVVRGFWRGSCTGGTVKMTQLILSGGEVAAELIVVIGNVLRRFLFAYHEAIRDIILEQCDIVACNIVLLKLRFCGPTLIIFVTHISKKSCV